MTSTPAPAAADTAINFEKRVGQYVKLRDLIKAKDDAHDEAMKPLKETLEKLNGVLLAHVNAVGGDGVMTSAGTVSKTLKYTASIADASAFWSWVVSQGAFDMVDKKANLTAMKEYAAENNGALPPGVNLTSVEKVNVKRKTGT
jgi:hypothetical protein